MGRSALGAAGEPLDARRLCEPGAEGPAIVARAMAGQLGWDDARVEREVADWQEVARAEGLVPEAVAGARAATATGADNALAPDAADEPSPTAPGAAPEEAA